MIAAVAAAVIQLDALTKDFGQGRGVFGLDLEVFAGETVGFLGPNGAGKSTTMRLLLDQLRPTRGSAQVLGLDARRDSLAIRRRVGFLPGDFAMYPKLTGAELLAWFGKLRGGVDPRLRAELVERFEAQRQLDRPIRELSTGNRQKIGLIQAFMHAPELLILDEPITGLDPLVQQRFHALLHEVVQQGRTVFLSSHTLSEVERVAQRVAIVKDGRLVVVDTLERLRAVAIQRLEVDFEPYASTPDDAALRAVPGVTDVTVSSSETHAVIAYEGSIDPLIKFLSSYSVRSLRSRDDDLESIFLKYYA
jgi:ABC-2 type transport system ATP-binding protein